MGEAKACDLTQQYMTNINFGLEERNVLIIGGSSGIGYVLVHHFAKQGSNVTIVAHVEEVHASAERLSQMTERMVCGMRCDISNRADVAAMMSGQKDIDVLINNAGMGAVTAVTDESAATAALVQRTFEVNYLGLYWVTQAAISRMSANGRIIFTTSLWAHAGAPQFSAYVASKHALVGLVQSLAIEVGPLGITVNAVSPGSMDTELNRTSMPQSFIDHLCGQMKIKPGLISPDALAGTYLFLASDAAADITGQVIPVDRGQTVNW